MILTADLLDLRRADPTFGSDFDALITDPPYSGHVHGSMISNHSDGAGPSQRDVGFDALTTGLRRAIVVTASYVKRWTFVFSDVESTHLWRDDMARLGLGYIREVADPDEQPCECPHCGKQIVQADVIPSRWLRWSQPQNSGDRPPTGAEATLVFHATTGGQRPKPVKKHWNGPGNLTYWPQKSLRGEAKYGAEKPLDLMLAIISAFSDPGEAVLDPCAGVGTTHRACDLLGRECLAVEALPDVAARAEARCASALSPAELDRAERFCDWAYGFASMVPERASGEIGHAAWTRAQRQLADVGRVARAL